MAASELVLSIGWTILSRLGVMEDSATIRAKLVFLEEVETRTSSVCLVMVSMARWTGERSELISHFNSPQLPRPYWQEGNMDG